MGTWSPLPETGAELVINSDTHAPGDLYTPELMEKVGLGAGLTRDELTKVLTKHPGDFCKNWRAETQRNVSMACYRLNQAADL